MELRYVTHHPLKKKFGLDFGLRSPLSRPHLQTVQHIWNVKETC